MANEPTAALGPDQVLGQGIGEPATHLFLITPSDTANLKYQTRALRVGTGGDLAVKLVSGELVTIPDVAAAETLPLCAVKVYATNTTASGIVGYA